MATSKVTTWTRVATSEEKRTWDVPYRKVYFYMFYTIVCTGHDNFSTQRPWLIQCIAKSGTYSHCIKGGIKGNVPQLLAEALSIKPSL